MSGSYLTGVNAFGWTALAGFAVMFLLYQLAEASGQDLLPLPQRPYSTFLLFILVIIAAVLVGGALGADGLGAFRMGLLPGWWQGYLLGLGAGLLVEGGFEWIGVRLGIRQVSHIQVNPRSLVSGFFWILLGNFPAAAAEDLITRGYPYHFLHAAPLWIFLLVSVGLFTFNHVLRLVIKPISTWYHLPFVGLVLAYVLARTGSLWPVIGLHQAGNVIYYGMQQTMQVHNTTDLKKRMAFGAASELVLLALAVFILR